MIQLLLAERIKDQEVEQSVDIPAPPVMEDMVAVVQEVVSLVPEERVQRRPPKHFVDMPFLRFWK